MIIELYACVTWPPMKKVRGWIVLVPLEDEHFLVLVQESKTTRGGEGDYPTIVFASSEESTVFASKWVSRWDRYESS